MNGFKVGAVRKLKSLFLHSDSLFSQPEIRDNSAIVFTVADSVLTFLHPDNG